MTDPVPFESDDMGVRFLLDARYEQSPPLRDPPGFHIAAAHFTLSVPCEWLASFHVVEAASKLPVFTADDLEREVGWFLDMQRRWDLERTEILEWCHAIELDGLPAWRTVHVISPAPGEGEKDDEMDPAPVLTQQHAVFDGMRRIHIDLSVLPADRLEAQREALELPFRTLHIERRSRRGD